MALSRDLVISLKLAPLETWLAGYSLPSRSIDTRIFRSSNAPQDLLKRNKSTIIYGNLYRSWHEWWSSDGESALSRKDQYSPFSIYPGIVGIHGRSEEYGNTQSGQA